jgi:hypothetical protein
MSNEKTDAKPQDAPLTASPPLTFFRSGEPAPRYGWGNYREFVKEDDQKKEVVTGRVFTK